MPKTQIPLISVVIPAYNEEKYLPACLASLKNQTFQDFEIIVVDNNSTDKTAEVAQRLGARVIKEPIQGMTPARERGFKEARAQIIARTDADSILTPDWLEVIDKTFAAHPDVVAITGVDMFSDVGWLLRLSSFIFFNFIYVHFNRLLFGHHQLSGPNYALRKSTWEKVKVHRDDKLVHEDIDISCHLAERGKIQYCPAMRMTTSLRRWNRYFFSTLYEYTVRYIKTISLHHPYLRRHVRLPPD